MSTTPSLLAAPSVRRRTSASTSFVLGCAAKRLRLRAIQVDPSRAPEQACGLSRNDGGESISGYQPRENRASTKPGGGP
jgi:hypothetical protein